MIISAMDSDASKWEVVDRETGAVLRDVVWANDATHEYIQRVRDEHGIFMRDQQSGFVIVRRVTGSPIVIRPTMARFHLRRNEDETGISGTGLVAEGVCFSDGRCVMRWLTDRSSVAMYDSMEDLMAIHGHNGKTVVEWKG